MVVVWTVLSVLALLRALWSLIGSTNYISSAHPMLLAIARNYVFGFACMVRGHRWDEGTFPGDEHRAEFLPKLAPYPDLVVELNHSACELDRFNRYTCTCCWAVDRLPFKYPHPRM